MTPHPIGVGCFIRLHQQHVTTPCSRRHSNEVHYLGAIARSERDQVIYMLTWASLIRYNIIARTALQPSYSIPRSLRNTNLSNTSETIFTPWASMRFYVPLRTTQLQDSIWLRSIISCHLMTHENVIIHIYVDNLTSHYRTHSSAIKHVKQVSQHAHTSSGAGKNLRYLVELLISLLLTRKP